MIVYRQALHYLHSRMVRNVEKWTLNFAIFFNRQEIIKRVKVSLFVINDIISSVFAINK